MAYQIAFDLVTFGTLVDASIGSLCIVTHVF